MFTSDARAAAPAAAGRKLLAILLCSAATPAFGQAGTTLPPQEGATTSTAPTTDSPLPPASGSADPETVTPVVADAPAAPQAGASGVGLGDIIVTATKRETNLQRTPIAISVVNAQALEDRSVQSLLDLGDGSVPGLRVATFESRQSAVTIGIRGIVPLDANQPAREQGVGVYLDGVYLGRQQGLGAALLDVERIEVLKGPQGTLFGRNTSGGAVSMVTKAPTGEFGIRGGLGVGNYDSFNGNAHIDFPAVGPFSFKLDLAADYRGPVTKNPMPGEKGWGYYDRQGLQAKLRFRPVPDFTADLSFDIGKDKSTPFYSQLINFNPNNYPLATLTGSLPSNRVRPLPPLVVIEGDELQKVADIGVPQRPSVDKTRGLSLNMRWNLSDWLELRSISAWRKVSVDQWDNAGGAHRPPVFSPNGLFSRYSLSYLEQRQYSQEFQAVGTLADQLDYVAGLYYFDEKAFEEAATPNSLRWNATGTAYTVIDSCTGSSGFGWDRECRFIDRGSRVRSKSRAAYGQVTWTPPAADQFHLTLGGRYTRDTKDGVLYLTNNAPSRCPPTLATAPLCTLDLKTSRFNPLVTLAYDATPGVHLYAKYATGYRSGGASSRSVTYREFGPEDVKSYELGAKTELFGRRLRVNGAAFVMNREGSQVDFSSVVPTAAGNRNTLETINAPGTTKIRGVEIDFLARVTDNLQLSGAYAYTYTKVPDTPDPFRPGNPLVPAFIVYTPRNVANGAIDYEMPLNWNEASLRFHVDGNYNQATQSFAEYATKNDSSFLVNARVSLADVAFGNSSYTFALWSRNLFDNQYIFRRDPLTSLPNPLTGAVNAITGEYANFGMPRTFGAELSFKFRAPRPTVMKAAAPLPPPLPATQTCPDGSVVDAGAGCPVTPPPPPTAEPAGERG
ncbi:TonB-dependent receptor [Sphingomonas piscis]|uniref:TonB-dependent receptor n=1 Tax=Sphingomonas piscis TaxID=2714943 RepID=A0A6G7YQ08_9SPHN|nr:TonB-dependent receptor [Sphingomonas piscis]QIK78819.1 TonB-dependent receptor [Sphingomonas piscis]